jgi:invasion protein IalB
MTSDPRRGAAARSALAGGILGALAAGMAAQGAAAQGAAGAVLPERRDQMGDWMVECFDAPDIGAPCQIYQRVVYRASDGSVGPVAVLVAAFAYRDGKLHVALALPLGFDLAQGAVLGIDGDSFALPVARCVPRGCMVEGQIGGTLSDRLGAAQRVGVTVSVPGLGPFLMPLSMAGFGEALGAIAPPARTDG